MGKQQQRKGADGERELVDLLQGLGYTVTRGKSQSYGSEPDLSGLPGIHCEVKRVERLNIETAMQQAERDALRFMDGIPAVFHRRNRCRWMVTMRLQAWLCLYKKSRRGEGSPSDDH